MSIVTEKIGTVVTILTQMSGFHHQLDQTCVLLGYQAVCCGNILSLWDSLSGISSRIKNPPSSILDL